MALLFFLDRHKPLSHVMLLKNATYEMLKSIGTMHMSWISGNLNELEDPIAKVNSWYICECQIK